jgi:nucleoside 2-deoxyribosyltransferase
MGASLARRDPAVIVPRMTAAVYIAGPLFTQAEREWNSRISERLRQALPGVVIMLPQEFCAVHEAGHTADLGHGREGKPDFGAIFKSCRDHLDQCTHVVAILDGADADSGTSWEMGYAYAKGRTVIGLRTDWRPAEDGGGNAMLTRSCAMVCGDIEEIADRLRIWLRLPTASAEGDAP